MNKGRLYEGINSIRRVLNQMEQELDGEGDSDADNGAYASAEEAPLVPGGSIRMPFGKHKNRTIQEIFENAPDYLEWAAENLQLRQATLAQAIKAAVQLIRTGPDEIEDGGEEPPF